MKLRQYLSNILCGALLLVAMVAQAAEPIRIGTTQSLTGQFEEFGKTQMKGLQMWRDDINARGELLGRPVELVAYDDHSDAARSAWLYRKLINEDKVDLLIGPYSSELTLAASDVAEEFNVPMVAAAASAEKIWNRGHKNIFGIDTPSSNYMDPAIQAAAERGAKTIALFYADAEFTREVADGIRREARKHGIRIILDESYPVSQREFQELGAKLQSANADLALGASYLEDSVAIGRSLGAGKRLDVDMVALTVGPATREFSERLFNNVEGVVGVVQWLRTVRMPGAQDFSYRYRQKYGENPAVHAAIGYSAGQVLEAAVRLSGSLDKAALRDQLRSMRFRSLLGHYQVDETGRQVAKSNYLLQWQDGRRRLVWPDKIAERELIYPRP